MAVPETPITLSNALHTVAINGAYNASRALSKWLHRGVRLTSDGFSKLPISEAASVIGPPDQAIAAIHMPLAGDVTGHMLLAFPERVALRLADIMMQNPEGTATEFDELERSCLQETGNIVGSAYANSLAKWLKLRIEPRVPMFLHDMASSIIDPLLAESATTHDDVLMAMTDFLLDGERMRWAMLLVPSEASLRAMESRCEMDTVRREALKTIAINGAFNASRAMSKWLKRGVRLSTEGFIHVPLSDITNQFDEATPIVALHMPISNHMHGHALLTMPKMHAQHLAALLTGETPNESDEISELAQSCLQETGNIIASSFLNSWSNWLDLQLEPGAPQFVVDMPEAVIASVVTEQALVGDDVYLARTDFVVDEHWLELVFILLPAPSAMRLVETACA